MPQGIATKPPADTARSPATPVSNLAPIVKTTLLIKNAEKTVLQNLVLQSNPVRSLTLNILLSAEFNTSTLKDQKLRVATMRLFSCMWGVISYIFHVMEEENGDPFLKMRMLFQYIRIHISRIGCTLSRVIKRCFILEIGGKMFREWKGRVNYLYLNSRELQDFLFIRNAPDG